MSFFHAPVGPFKVVGDVLEKKLLGPSVNIEATFPLLQWPYSRQSETHLESTGGPIQNNR